MRRISIITLAFHNDGRSLNQGIRHAVSEVVMDMQANGELIPALFSEKL